MRIVNQTKSLLIVTLNSGVTLHLAPGQSSEPVAEMEVSGNEKVEKLRRSGVVSVVNGSAG